MSNLPVAIQSLVNDLDNVVVIKNNEIVLNTLNLDNIKINRANNVTTLYNKYDDVIYIDVTFAQVVEEKVHVFYVYDEDSNSYIYINSSLNTKLEYGEYIYIENGAKVNFHSLSHVDKNSSLIHFGVTNVFDGTLNVTRQSFVYEYGSVEMVIGEMSRGDVTANTMIDLMEPEANGISKSVVITAAEQKSFYKQTVAHKAKYTKGYIENYGVAADQSKLLFEGVGQIDKGNSRSEARQSNKGIILGEFARLDANPLLIIDEYDVEASHGAAIGKVDEEQLYYLMSRGMTFKSASRLIINGYLTPILSYLNEGFQTYFMQEVEQKLN
jgi:Fe-S cluster assembly protein SufD